jgi:hypothetical protein
VTSASLTSVGTMHSETRTYRTGTSWVVLDLTHDAWHRDHHGRSHVIPAHVPPYATVPVADGALLLGTR